MSKLLRYWSGNDLVFITTVTFDRMPILVENIDLVRLAVTQAKAKLCFEEIAYSVLPDHYHVILNTYRHSGSEILQSIKMSFAAHYRKRFGMYRGRVWQRRFYDHLIRDEADYRNCLNYVHGNSVRHGLAQRPADYEFTSFHWFVENGYYESDWQYIDNGMNQIELGE